MKDGGPSKNDASAGGGASSGGSTMAGSSGGSAGDAATGSGGVENDGASSGGTATGGTHDGGATEAGSGGVPTSPPDASTGGQPPVVDAGPPPCATGTVSCGTDRCVDLDVTPDHCGTCSVACASTGALTVTCVTGVCKPTCDKDHADCNKAGTDGCEIDTQTDPNNCGACGHVCAGSGASQVACVAGVCKPICATGFGDCSTPSSSSTDDGCETSLNAPTSCGGCGRDCQGGACTNERCQPLTLTSGIDTAFTIDANYVHWFDDTGIYRVPILSSTSPHLVMASSSIDAISDNGSYLFVSIQNSA
ncbi:MAG TPA: hypothetical protein VH142_23685, partial [Polyangiaceae bacterium]|nr:hypothetical protein [Polyangiaceae bacterium]